MAYRFDHFELLPESRLLLRDGVRIEVPRRVFDCLLLLIEQRERALGRDELIRHVWKRDNVSDNQLNQTVVAARRLLGDASAQQRLIRTVPGFGYQWAGVVECIESSVAAAAAASVEAAPAAAFGADASVTAGIPGRALASASGRTRHGVALMAALGLLLATALLLRAQWSDVGRSEPSVLRVQPTGQLWVLPAQVPEQEDLSWARVGLMALVGERMRRHGMEVVPLEHVLLQLRTQESASSTAGTMPKLPGDSVLRIGAQHHAGYWQVMLELAESGAGTKRVTGSHVELLAAARIAADLLAVRLGAQTAIDGSTLEEHLEAIRQAIRGGDLAGARTQLALLPEAEQAQTDTMLMQVFLEMRASRLEAARVKLEQVYAEHPAPDAKLEGRLLLMRAELVRREGSADWTEDIDRAVALLETVDAPRDLAMAMMARGTRAVMDNRHPQAGGDFQRARRLYLQIGDEVGAATALSNLGRLAILEARSRDAIEQLGQAAATYARYGAADLELTALSSQIAAQAHLLLWRQALAAAERCRDLLAFVPDPSARQRLLLRHAHTLMETGQLTRARKVLAEAEEVGAGQRLPVAETDMVPLTHAMLAQATLDPQRTREAARLAFTLAHAEIQRSGRASLSSRESRDLALLLGFTAAAQIPASHGDQVAATPTPEEHSILATPDTVPGWIARGKWLAQSGARDDAEAALRRAVEISDRTRPLAHFRHASVALVEFLITDAQLDQAGQQMDVLYARDDGGLDQDYLTALTALRLEHARGHRDGWEKALAQARKLAGERPIPPELQQPPAGRS